MLGVDSRHSAFVSVKPMIESNNTFDICAICILDDYHDSDQFICDDCYRELESLKADQLASRWD